MPSRRFSMDYPIGMSPSGPAVYSCMSDTLERSAMLPEPTWNAVLECEGAVTHFGACTLAPSSWPGTEVLGVASPLVSYRCEAQLKDIYFGHCVSLTIEIFHKILVFTIFILCYISVLLIFCSHFLSTGTSWMVAHHFSGGFFLWWQHWTMDAWCVLKRLFVVFIWSSCDGMRTVWRQGQSIVTLY